MTDGVASTMWAMPAPMPQPHRSARPRAFGIRAVPVVLRGLKRDE